MNVRASWGAVAIVTLLVVGTVAGFYAMDGSDTETMPTQNVSAEVCEELPNYDYERMLSRVEEIKGAQMRRNVTLCTEQSSTGIDTTPAGGQFARVEESGLTFFELDTNLRSDGRSSLGHTEFSPSSGQIEIFLANESVVENVPWISYETLVVHELSDAIEVTASTSRSETADAQATKPQTTDAILARQSLSNGISLYVSDRYARQYDGYLNASALHRKESDWRRQVVQSVYYFGYRYSVHADSTSIVKTGRLNSTAQILHPNETRSVTGTPPKPNLSVDSLEHVRTDRIGELFLRETLRSKGISPDRAAAAADGWVNDRMDYYHANGSSIVSWRVTWQNADERAEFVEAYDAVYEYEQVDSTEAVRCGEPGRYLTISEKTVSVVQCSD